MVPLQRLIGLPILAACDGLFHYQGTVTVIAFRTEISPTSLAEAADDVRAIPIAASTISPGVFPATFLSTRLSQFFLKDVNF
jgi:hypothetical protein